ncbi:MAG: hypothetical protein HYW33_00090 [Candidatus Blackburnbacteria bacterium]|nr:hypothetical protein [Candidatus Blackburnbacteria bacterium]
MAEFILLMLIPPKNILTPKISELLAALAKTAQDAKEEILRKQTLDAIDLCWIEITLFCL